MNGAPRPSRTATRADDGWEALFWLVFERSSNAIALLDQDQRILAVNEPALSLFGRSRSELLGTSVEERFPPAERRAATRDWHVLMRTGEGVGKRVLERSGAPSIELEWAARLAEIGEHRVVIAVMLRGITLPRPHRLAESVQALTPREREIVTLIALGYDTREITTSLYISPETVKSHVRKAMSKLCARTRAQLVAVALSSGQIARVPYLAE